MSTWWLSRPNGPQAARYSLAPKDSPHALHVFSLLRSNCDSSTQGFPSHLIAKGSSEDLAAGNRQGQATPNRKRSRPRSAVEESPINARSPPKWRSPRRCSNNGENCNGNGCSKLSECNIACSHFSGKPKWNPRDPAQLQAVKEALHIGSAPKNIVCREEEQRKILEFCKACIREERAGSLYVCGCPGTGKTLSIDKVKELLLTWSKEVGLQSPDMLSINCTSLTKTSEIFSKVLENFQSRNKANGCLSPLQCLQNCFSQKRQLSSRKMMLIIIDEMDYLITKDRAVLHDLFMLTTFPFSKCILIGIANAIDLADRFLPKLESLNCKPMVVTFPAYSKDQILQILQQRLTVLGYDVFQSVALDFCARKVAAASGDMRRALDVCRIAIEVLQAELGDSTAKQEVDAVMFDHMDIALSKAFKSAVVDTIHSLPQHQQIILCSLVKLFFHCKKNATTLGELNREYSQICKSNQIPSVSMLEFSNMCRVLGDQGLLKLGQSREDKLRRVTLQVDTSDITFAFKESPKSAHVYLVWHQEDPTMEDMKDGLKFLVTHHKGRHNARDK